MYQKNLNNYKKTQILTAEPGKIILMLLEGGMTFLLQAADHAEKKSMAKKANLILRTKNIILELLAALNYEKGAEIACNLREIYTFLLGELDRADLNNDIERILKCREVLGNIREGWAAMLEERENTDSTQPQKHLEALSYSSVA